MTVLEPCHGFYGGHLPGSLGGRLGISGVPEDRVSFSALTTHITLARLGMTFVPGSAVSR